MTDTTRPFTIELDQADIDALEQAVHLAWSSDNLRTRADHERMEAALNKIKRQAT